MDEAPTAVRPNAGLMPQPMPAHERPGRSRRPRKRYVILSVIGVLALVVVAGVAWFQPYKLWIDKTVNEAAPQGAVVIAQGSFVSHEHATSGSVRLFRLPDGSRVLRLDQLDTSNGPRLAVWLSDAPVRTGKAGWHVFASSHHVDLGRLKGNVGSQNYLVPPSADLASLSSVTVWCERFHVSFGAAPLRSTG